MGPVHEVLPHRKTAAKSQNFITKGRDFHKDRDITVKLGSVADSIHKSSFLVSLLKFTNDALVKNRLKFSLMLFKLYLENVQVNNLMNFILYFH